MMRNFKNTSRDRLPSVINIPKIYPTPYEMRLKFTRIIIDAQLENLERINSNLRDAYLFSRALTAVATGR